MGTIAQELTRIQTAKSDLKTAIEAKGVTVPSATTIDGYASLIDQIEQGGDTDGLDGKLSVESKTIATSASTTANIAYNNKCGIYDENGVKWDVLEWHQRWVDNGYSAQGLSKPTGIWMNAFGLESIYLWMLYDENGYSDVTGTIDVTNDTFQSFVYSVECIKSKTTTDRTVWPANQSGMISHGTAGKYNSDTFRTINNGDGLDMVCDNTKETFTIPSRDIGTCSSFSKDNYEDYMWGYYEQCEFLRALFAICSGIACPTGTANGTKTTVEILNSSGQQPSVGEDMYFWINGSNSGLLAKYNINSKPTIGANSTSAYLTQAISDAIYAKQKQNGVNMNDTGVNSSTKPTLLPGMKGAEAIAVDGYWYIKTPYISNPSSTFSDSKNMVDAPLIYFCKHKGVSLLSDRRIFAYYINITTLINGITNLLSSIEGLTDVRSADRKTLYCATQNFTTYMWYVSINSGGTMGGQSTINRYSTITCPSLTFKDN